MKTKSYAVFVGVCVAAGLAIAGGSAIVSEAINIASATAPTAASFSPTVPGSSTIGNALNLDSVDGFRVSVCTVDSAAVLGQTGTLRAYLYDERDGLVKRNPSIDLTVTGSTRCQVFPDQEVKVPMNQVMYITDTLKLGDGGTLNGDAGTGAFTINQRGWRKQ